MRNRVLVLLSVVTLLMVVVSASVLVVAQSQAGAAATPNVKSGGTANSRLVWDPTAPPPANWTPPRTPWGDPDLRGYYLNLSYTPLQRPQALAGKAMYTNEEAVEAFKKAVALDAEVDPTTIHYDWKEYGMDQWQSPVRPNRRTSMIVDPPDGRIPPLTEEAKKRRDEAAAREKAKGNDVQSPGTYTRCITGNGGPPRVPVASPPSPKSFRVRATSFRSSKRITTSASSRSMGVRIFRPTLRAGWETRAATSRATPSSSRPPTSETTECGRVQPAACASSSGSRWPTRRR